MRAESVSIEPYGDIAVNLASFTRALAATNLSPRTIQSYTESTQLLARFLAERSMPTSVALIRREHLEAFVASLIAKWKPATAHNRYRGCQAFFRWLADEGEVAISPFAKMRPPRIPEASAPVLTDAQVKALVGATNGRTFEDKRDAAIIRIFLDTGLRLAELANLRYDPRAEAGDVDLDFRRLRVLGKGRRERLVAISARTVAAIDRYLRARARHRSASCPYLWLGRKGRFTASGIGQMVRDRGRGAGLGDAVHATCSGTPSPIASSPPGCRRPTSCGSPDGAAGACLNATRPRRQPSGHWPRSGAWRWATPIRRGTGGDRLTTSMGRAWA